MKNLTFQILEGVDKGKVFRHLPIPVTIGREEGNLLRLNDERVSRFHAKVQHDDDDIILTDLDSTNGTRVNGNPVQIRRLRPGDQIGVGRSTILFGTLEEIAARKANLSHKARSAPVQQTITGTKAGAADDLDFDLNLANADEPPATFGPDDDWTPTDRDLPPLPVKLTPAQAARVAEILDFLHRGLTSALDKIEANDEATQVKLPYAEWQKVQMVQLFLARYMRGVAEPDSMDM
jgi:pSer/pThr/pTyr-binding forkhead associated (FHA) protein